MKSKTIPIVFSGGSYGTYLEWVLTSLTSETPLLLPFKADGSSHLFKGNHLSNLIGWKKYVKSNQTHRFVRLHPHCGNRKTPTDTLNDVLSVVDKLILVKIDSTSSLLCCANFISKCFEQNFHRPNVFLTKNDINMIYKNWNINPDIKFEELPVWIKREFMSLWIEKSWESIIKVSLSSVSRKDSIHVVNVSSLLFDFTNTIQLLVENFSITVTQPPEHLLNAHNQMLSVQRNLNIANNINRVVRSLDSSDSHRWSNNFAFEVLLQARLRKLGYEIMCDGLDIFPSDSVSLRKLLYRP